MIHSLFFVDLQRLVTLRDIYQFGGEVTLIYDIKCFYLATPLSTMSPIVE
jgi:hypothetical protein